MTDFTEAAATWGRHAAVAGAVVFGLGWACVRRVAAPARRRELAAWVVRGGLAAAVLCALPAWLLLPAPRWAATPEAIPDRPRPLDEVRPVAVAPAEAGRWVVVMLAAEGLNPPTPFLERGGADPEGAKPLPLRGGVGEGLGPQPNPPAPFPRREGGAEPSLGVAPLVLLAYGVGVAVAAVPMVLGVVALVRLRRSGTPAPPAVQGVFDDLAAGCRARLLVSGRVSSPLCFGLFRPVVVIPKALAAGATEAELRWVFGHELDHLRRGDPWAGWWVAVARAVYFFVPWFWRVRRALVLAQEHLADAAAVAAGGRSEDYAAFLVRLSGGPAGRRHPVGAAGVRAGKSDLFWRVTMLLSSNDTTPARASRRWSAVVAAGVLGAAAVLSGVGFARPAQDEKPAPQEKSMDEKPAPKDDVQVGPPPQLEALRKAVEAAAKKGENVDDIRKQLDELEKALAGRAWRRPAVAPDAPPVPGAQRVPAFPNFAPPPGVMPVPAFPNFAPPPGVFIPPGAFAPPVARVMPNFPMAFDFPLGGGNADALRKANEALERAMTALQNNPNDRDVADKAIKEYQRLLTDALPNANMLGGAVVVGPDGQVRRFGLGGDARPVEAAVGGRKVNDGRLGIQVEKVPPLVVEQLGLDAGAGLVVSGVRDGSAAAKAGLKVNDILLEFAGKPVTDNAGEFARAVAAVKKGDAVDVTVLRKGKKEAVKGIELPDAVEVRPRPALDVDPVARVLPPRPNQALAPPVLPVPPAAGAAEFSSMSTSVTNGEFTIKAEQKGVTFTIVGTVDGGKAVPSKITIVDGETKVDANSVEKVPAAYRDRVTLLLRGVSGGR